MDKLRHLSFLMGVEGHTTESLKAVYEGDNKLEAGRAAIKLGYCAYYGFEIVSKKGDVQEVPPDMAKAWGYFYGESLKGSAMGNAWVQKMQSERTCPAAMVVKRPETKTPDDSVGGAPLHTPLLAAKPA